MCAGPERIRVGPRAVRHPHRTSGGRYATRGGSRIARRGVYSTGHIHDGCANLGHGIIETQTFRLREA